MRRCNSSTIGGHHEVADGFEGIEGWQGEEPGWSGIIQRLVAHASWPLLDTQNTQD